MLKNLTISGKVNLITEIIAIITWAILLIAAKDDWLFFAVFSIPLLILIPICGWFLVPVSKKISEKGKSTLNNLRLLVCCNQVLMNRPEFRTYAFTIAFAKCGKICHTQALLEERQMETRL